MTLSLLAVLQLFLLFLSWWSPGSSRASLGPAALHYCTGITIPYPFGIINSSAHFRQGFGIICDPSDNYVPMLRLGPGARLLRILNISLDGYVRVRTGLLGSERCKRGDETETAEPLPNLDGTPFTFNNTANKLTVVGCDALALLQDSRGRTASGCASFCYNASDVIDGSCSGVGCCQAPIPTGLKNFTLQFSSIRNLTGSLLDAKAGTQTAAVGRYRNISRPESYDYAACSRAFILEQQSFKFSNVEDLNGNARARAVVLDWAIGNETCEVARNSNSYACTENSECRNSPAGVGYLCRCNEGYEGNPYVPNGCQDVDECSRSDTSPCVSKCRNIPGGYICHCPPGTTGDGRKEGTGCKRIRPLDIGLGLGLVLLVLLITIISWAYYALNKRKVIKLKQRFFIQNGGLLLQQHISAHQMTARIFSLEELEMATEGFSESRVIGRGGYGTVYKGNLPDDRVIAIKKSKFMDEDQIEQFINEVVILSHLNHKNVVKLLGCCLESQVPMLVYEFIPNGTLFHHVHEKDPNSPLSWENRLRIATETAAAVAYLHSASTPIIHRDIKSANILLDENFTAKVADFGASRLVPYDQTHVTTLVQGTLGYLDPEYFHTSQLTEKSDVYSFGVVLVELLVREKPISFHRTEGERNLASYFVSLVKENQLLEVMDAETVKEATAWHVSVVAELARKCLSLKGEERPSMREVAVELDALRRLAEKHFVRPAHEQDLPVGNSSDPNYNAKLEKYGPETYILS